MSDKWHKDHKKAITEKWTQCPPVTTKVKELIGGQVCMGTYGLVELEVMQLERELAASKADRVAISQKLSDALDALFASNKQLAEARAEVERVALEIENQQYTITCASEENQQLKESLAEARAKIERLKAPALNASLLREKLAELAHNQWAGWMEYLFFKSKQVDGCVVIPAWANERWRRQVATRYTDLSEEEKDSDRSEADKFLAVFNAQLAERDKLIEQMRETLRLALAECRSTHCENEIKAALSVAERMSK